MSFPEGELTLPSTGFLYVPPKTAFTLHESLDSSITVFRNIYQAHPDLAPPPITHGLAFDRLASEIMD